MIAEHRTDVGSEKGPERRAHRNGGPWDVVADVGNVLRHRGDLGSSELQEAVTTVRGDLSREGHTARSSSVGVNREVTP